MVSFRLLTMIMRTALPLSLFLVSGSSLAAPARPVEIQSIQIVPSEATIGTHPEITGSIKADEIKGPNELRGIIVIAVVVRPDHVMKSWTWKNVRMRAGEIRMFTVPKEYEIKSTGSYKVDFNIYTSDMRPLHRLSKTFVVIDAMRPPAKTAVLEEAVTAGSGARPSQQAAGSSEIGRHIGLGLYANTLAPAAPPCFCGRSSTLERSRASTLITPRGGFMPTCIEQRMATSGHAAMI